MSWNYRIIKHREKGNKRQTWYGLHEVFYTKAGKPCLRTDPVDITGTSPVDLIQLLSMMLRDATRMFSELKDEALPVIDEKKIRWAKPDWEYDQGKPMKLLTTNDLLKWKKLRKKKKR